MVGNMELESRLKKHVKILAHDIGDRSVFQYKRLLQAQQYIEQGYNRKAYELHRQTFISRGKEVSNLIAQRKGGDQNDEIVVIGAHYDSCANPGADDNASGIAGLLELARLFEKVKLRRNIQFVAFVNEEPPFFKTGQMGSLIYAKKARAEKRRIHGALILEMIGYFSSKPKSQHYPQLLKPFYPSVGNFIAVVGDRRNGKLVSKVYNLFRKKSKFPIEKASFPAILPGIDFSDHWALWQAGYPAVMITDTSFYRNKNYHTETDTYESLNYGSMAQVILGLFHVIKELANE